MWTSLKICSHCVAVAATVGTLRSFVKWYVASANKPPNITKITAKNVPHNVGKKLSHSRYSSRKAKPPVTARIPPAYAKQSTESSVSGGMAGPSASSVASTAPDVGTSAGQSQFFDVSGSINAQHMNIGSYSTWYPDPSWSFYPYSTPWNYGSSLPSASFPAPLAQSPPGFPAAPPSYPCTVIVSWTHRSCRCSASATLILGLQARDACS